MDLSLSFFMQQISQEPVLLITVLLTLCVILVNGWTDAPNAIATCVSTRSMNVNLAIVMAAVFNFAGVLVMTVFNSTVAMTITNMVNFKGNTSDALIALCAALVSIVIWATLAWYFGIPTSESHALIAGLSGAAIALQGGMGGINGSAWMKVIYGLALSTVLGFCSGYFVCKLTQFFFRKKDRWSSSNGFHAWCSGRTEIYGCSVAWNLFSEWKCWIWLRATSYLDDVAMFRCNGTWYFHRR